MLSKIRSSGLIWLWVAILMLAVDRLTKGWALTNLVFHEPLEILPILNFTLAYNTGAAFSFLDSANGWQNVLLGAIAFIVSGSLIIWLRKLPARDWWVSIALCFIIAGAIGNVWDRIQYGYVIDFLAFHVGDWHFAIFNFADTVISLGACMLILSWLIKPKSI